MQRAAQIDFKALIENLRSKHDFSVFFFSFLSFNNEMLLTVDFKNSLSKKLS